MRRNRYCRAWEVEGQNRSGVSALRGYLGSSQLTEPHPVSMTMAVEDQDSIAQLELVGVAADSVPTECAADPEG